VSDPLEREADRIAEQVSAAPPSGMVQGTTSGGLVQRKCLRCEEDEFSQIQRKPLAQGAPYGSPSGFEPGLAGTGPGRPLPNGIRQFMQAQFSAEFSRVRVHDDAPAAALASSIGARAFTRGSDIFFGSGEYRYGTLAGRKLLAHELTHVVQQGAAAQQPASRAYVSGRTHANSGIIQRKIKIKGEDKFTGDPLAILKFVAKYELMDKLEIIREMHAKDVEKDYGSEEECALDIKVRHSSIKTLREVERRRVKDRAKDLCCDYGTSLDGQSGQSAYYLNPEDWAANLIIPKIEESGYSFEADFQSKPGRNGADAINDIFKPKSDTERSRMDCAAMMSAVHYKSLTDVLDPEVFEAVFQSAKLSIVGFAPSKVSGDALAGSGLSRQWKVGEHDLVKTGVFERLEVEFDPKDPVASLFPGDRVYFQNHGLLTFCAPNSVWLGEHALYVGDNRFTGFGLVESGSDETMDYDEITDRFLVEVKKECQLKSTGSKDWVELERREGRLSNEKAGTLMLQADKLRQEATSLTSDDIPGMKHLEDEATKQVKTLVYRLNPKKLNQRIERKSAKLKNRSKQP